MLVVLVYWKWVVILVCHMTTDSGAVITLGCWCQCDMLLSYTSKWSREIEVYSIGCLQLESFLAFLFALPLNHYWYFDCSKYECAYFMSGGNAFIPHFGHRGHKFCSPFAWSKVFLVLLWLVIAQSGEKVHNITCRLQLTVVSHITASGGASTCDWTDIGISQRLTHKFVLCFLGYVLDKNGKTIRLLLIGRLGCAWGKHVATCNVFPGNQAMSDCNN